MFNYIDVDNWERKEHFDYYRTKIVCGYCMTVKLDITHFLEQVKKNNLRFYPSFIYCAARIVNSMKEFKMGVDAEGRPGYYDVSNPNLTIFHEDNHTFSDLWTEYSPDFKEFYKNTVDNMDKYSTAHGIKVRANQPPNFFCISCVPWVEYESYNTYTPAGTPNMFPILTFGKFSEKDGKYTMPFTLNISHASADGYHTGKFINDLQELLNTIEL